MIGLRMSRNLSLVPISPIVVCLVLKRPKKLLTDYHGLYIILLAAINRLEFKLEVNSMAEQIEQSGNNGSVLTFRLGNADFAVKRELWPVEKLQLDPKNQRLGYLLRQHKKAPTVSDKELHKMLWDIDQVKSLHQSVYQNGGLLEDPVVRVDGTVVEGNCRTVVMRELRKRS